MEKEKTTERIAAVPVNRGFELEEDDDDVDEAAEEEKIDKFYALIRNFREVRNRWRNELIITNNHELEMRKKNKRKYCNESSSGWTPTFELDDFKQDYLIKRKPLQIFPPPLNNCKKQEEEEDRDENGLDLKLTL